MEPREYLDQTFHETASIQKCFLDEHATDLIRVAEELAGRIKRGGKLIVFGNGGSAADSQHLAAEMIGKMLIEREPLPAIALTTDSSILTALGNDFGFNQVFSKQIQALARPDDLVLAISTSGKSENVLLAAREAKKLGCLVVGLTGGAGGELKSEVDICLNVSLGKNSSRIQESHIFAIHSIVDLMDRFFLK